jgi:hypothetical protein
MGNDNFFDGLDDAEDVPTPEVTDTPTEAAAPEAAKPDAVPADKAPEAAAKPADKPADKPQEKAADAPAEKPDAKPAVAENQPTQPDPRKWVPVGAHVELRNQLKAMQEEIQRLKNPPPASAPKVEPPAPPDFTADPKAYVDHKVQAALEQLETGLKPVQQKAEAAEASSAETRFFTHLQNAEQAFVATNPDYYDALGHLRNLRAAEIRLLDPDVTQEQLGQLLQREELQLAANILRSGRNPSEVAFNLAKARGWAPKPVKAPEAPKPPEEKLKLPDVPAPKQLPPDLTLGTGTGSPVQADDNDDPFESAWKEVFGARKRA